MPIETTSAAAILADDFARRRPERAAAHLEELSEREALEFVASRSDDVAVALLEALRPDTAAAVIANAGPERRRRWLSEADPARMAAALAHLEDEARAVMLTELERPTARELESILGFPPETAGAIMDPRVTRFRATTRVAEALSRVRGLRHRRISNVHVVDDDGVYLGPVRIQDLAVAEPGQAMRELVSSPALSVVTTAPRSEVVELLESSHQPTVPVVDFEGRLVGVIRQEALREAVEAEATADIQAMVGASRTERALSPVGFAVRKRLPWLQVNLLTAFLASFVVSLFESTIAQFTALAVLLPVVAGQSGNTGAQALAVTMRGLALREIRTRHALRVALKESAVGAVNGVAVALVTAAAVLVWSRSAGLATVIGVAMVLSMLIAGLAGAVIPMILTVLGQDPAQASSIVLTTVTDIAGFLSFLGLATMFSAVL